MKFFTNIAKWLLTFVKCPYKELLGISCPGCGMTRAWISALRLDFKEAFYYHPLFWMVPLIIIVIILKKKINTKVYNGLLLFFIACFMVLYVYRLCDADCSVVSIKLQDGLLFQLIGFITRR